MIVRVLPLYCAGALSSSALVLAAEHRFASNRSVVYLVRSRTSSLLCALIALMLAACSTRDSATPSNDGPAPDANALHLVSVVAGNMFTCAIDRAGEVWCWGSNDFAQLARSDREDRRRPVHVALPTPTVRLTAGEARVCAVDSLRTLRCWGDNVAWALADSTVTLLAEPRVMPVGEVQNVAAGSRFTCATNLQAEAYCWGGDRLGELGDGGDSLPARVTPGPVGVSVTFDTLVAGRTHACGLTPQGDAWCWGDKALSGDGSREKRTAPVAVAGNHRFLSLTAGESVTCGVDLESAAWCWGVAYDGQLGFAQGTENSFLPMAVAGGHRFVQLAAGYHRVCGLDTDGLAWCWGSNYRGTLGDTGRVSSLTPVPVQGARRYVSIASGDSHACALDTDGRAWCWGRNVIGQGGGALGDGTVESRSFPVPVIAPAATEAATRDSLVPRKSPSNQ